MLSIDPVSIFLFTAICLILYVSSYGAKRASHKFPPGPIPLPLIGNLHMINMRKPCLTLMELSKKYGSIFSVQLGTEKIVVLCGYDTMKDALIYHADEFSERSKIPIAEHIVKGNGIVSAHGENWKVMRRFTLSTLRNFGMGKRSLEDKINEECDCLVETFQFYKGLPFDNSILLNAAFANIIVSILIGHRFDYQDPTLLKLLYLINENFRIFGSQATMVYNMYPLIMKWIPGCYKALHENTLKLYEFIEETFTKHKDSLDINHQRDLIDVFLVKQQEEKTSGFFHDQNLTQLVADLFSAGMETTSTTVRWGLLLMMKYPDIQSKREHFIIQIIHIML
ncbi:hypothetical protein GDO86_010535 [Hymenochirus boettgeri]|uniref:Uncharacterized protein n=1 Tax=Hymenochirus boettgeri TaxID=247094 RepID=A0A8T2JNG0_9PIPI|nr:hypothetical protein GDO86_010535 [Hymenochirus boettgeri]